MIRKFYDAAVAEPKYKIGETMESEKFFSQDVNDVESEEKEEVKDEKVDAKVEDKKDEKVEDKKDEKVEYKKEESKTDDNKVEVKEPDWKEIVGKQTRKDVLSLFDIDEETAELAKELKGDDFIKKAVTYRKTHGNLTPFIDAATKDYAKFSHEQLIMDDLKQQYSALSPDKKEKLAKSDFNARFVYKDDPSLSLTENEEMAELMAIKLEAEGEKIRAAKVAGQKEFLDNVKLDEKAKPEVAIEKAVAEHNKRIADEDAKFKTMVEADPAKAKLFTSKQLVYGKGDSSFNHTVNPDLILEQTFNVKKFDDQFWHEGKFLFENFAKVAAYAQDVDGTEEKLINHGRSLSTKQLDEELENAKEEKDDKKEVKKKSLAKTFATEGVPMNGADL